jgi:hypothetical protein
VEDFKGGWGWSILVIVIVAWVGHWIYLYKPEELFYIIVVTILLGLLFFSCHNVTRKSIEIIYGLHPFGFPVSNCFSYIFASFPPIVLKKVYSVQRIHTHELNIKFLTTCLSDELVNVAMCKLQKKTSSNWYFGKFCYELNIILWSPLISRENEFW